MMSSSGGNKEIFHSKDFPKRLLKEMDAHVKETYPILWKKYLFRYDT